MMRSTNAIADDKEHYSLQRAAYLLVLHICVPVRGSKVVAFIRVPHQEIPIIKRPYESMVIED